MVQGHPTLIRVGFSEEELWQRFWEVAVGLIAGLPLCLGLAGFGGYFLARRALAPVDRMATRAEEIHAERLSERIKIDNPNDELGRLGQAFNRTLARLERSFENMRQFTADASHELRTPLTAIRSVGEVGLQTDGDKEYYREVIGSMLEESARLNRLVSSLLTISRADAGQIPLDRKPLELLPFVRETCARLEILADEKRQSLSVTGDSGVWVQADPTILRQVMVNLLDNAIKYSPEGSKICVHVVSRNGAGAVIEFQDEGPGISPEHRDRIFDRFYRIDEARSRETGGAGLGLAIAKWGAEIHGGRLNLADTQGVGSVFRVSLS
jgi:heavy metal sensor kinase